MHAGRCLCGRARFEARGGPKWVAHCHCQSCRRATASPLTTYAGFPADAVSWSGEAAAEFASSKGVIRRFCGHCGTPLSYESVRWPDEVHLFVATMNAPEALPPQCHVHTAERLAWLHLADDLPQNPGSGASSS